MKIPSIPKGVFNQSWKIVLLPALLAIFNSVAGHLGYSIKIEETDNKPVNSPLPTEVDTPHQLVSPLPSNPTINIQNEPNIVVENNQGESSISNVNNSEVIPVLEPPKQSFSIDSLDSTGRESSSTENQQDKLPEPVLKKTTESDPLISITMPSATTKSLLK